MVFDIPNLKPKKEENLKRNPFSEDQKLIQSFKLFKRLVVRHHLFWQNSRRSFYRSHSRSSSNNSVMKDAIFRSLLLI